MRTLLLALVVVGFVYLDLAHTLSCCSRRLCIWGEQCAEGENVCFQRKNGSDILGLKVVRGCASACPTPVGGEKVQCCSTDDCNKVYIR